MPARRAKNSASVSPGLKRYRLIGHTRAISACAATAAARAAAAARALSSSVSKTVQPGIAWEVVATIVGVLGPLGLRDRLRCRARSRCRVRARARKSECLLANA